MACRVVMTKDRFVTEDFNCFCFDTCLNGSVFAAATGTRDSRGATLNYITVNAFHFSLRIAITLPSLLRLEFDRDRSDDQYDTKPVGVVWFSDRKSDSCSASGMNSTDSEDRSTHVQEWSFDSSRFSARISGIGHRSFAEATEYVCLMFSSRCNLQKSKKTFSFTVVFVIVTCFLRTPTYPN